MQLKYLGILFLIGTCLAAEPSASPPEDVSEKTDGDEPAVDDAQDDLAIEESCNYTDSDLGPVTIKFMDVKGELEVLEMLTNVEDGEAVEDVILEGSDTYEDKLKECLQDDLQGRKIKRRGNKGANILLNRMRNQIRGPLAGVTIPELKRAMALGKKLLRQKMMQKRQIKNKTRGNRNRMRNRNRNKFG